MKRRDDRRRVVGIVLAGCLLAGCFVPIAYGGYKYYESMNQVGISVNIQEPADKVYQTAIATVEKRKVYEIVERNDKDRILSLRGITNKDATGTVTVKDLRAGRTSTFSVVANKWKDVDPNVQKQQLVNSVLSVCSELGIVCTEEKGDKKAEEKK